MRCIRASAQQTRPVCHRNNDRARRFGVTMIEAFLVILVLSGVVIASSFVLDENWVSNRNVKDLTIEVSQTLDAARNTAIANRCNVQVRRVRVNGIEQLQITEDAGPHRGEQQRTIPLGNEVTLRARPSEIEFTAHGTARRAATWIVTQGEVSGQIVSIARNSIQFQLSDGRSARVSVQSNDLILDDGTDQVLLAGNVRDVRFQSIRSPLPPRNRVGIAIRLRAIDSSTGQLVSIDCTVAETPQL